LTNLPLAFILFTEFSLRNNSWPRDGLFTQILKVDN
jgi:hypothetical protein